MADDVLRLRATVNSEQALADLQLLAKQIGLVQTKAGTGARTATTAFAQLGLTIKNVGREVSQLVPALGGVGLGAAGVGLAFGAVLRTMNDVAKRMTEVRHASRELGMSEREVRALGSAAEKVGISAQSMIQNFQSFTEAVGGIRYNVGGLRQELIDIGLSRFASELSRATSGGERLRLAFQMKDTILARGGPDAEWRVRRLFTILQLGPQAARLSLAEYNAELRKHKDLTDEEREAIKKYHTGLKDLGVAWDNLLVKAGVRMFPKLTEDVENLTRLIDKLDELDEWVRKNREHPGGLIGRTLQEFREWVEQTYGIPATPSGGPMRPQLAPGQAPWQRPPTAAPEPPIEIPESQQEQIQRELEERRRRLREQMGLPGRQSALPEDATMPAGARLTSFGGFTSSHGFTVARGGGGEDESAIRIVRTGVFEALVEFKSYVEAGAQLGGGSGVIRASLGGIGGPGGGPSGVPGGPGGGPGRGAAPSSAPSSTPPVTGGAEPTQPSGSGVEGAPGRSSAVPPASLLAQAREVAQSGGAGAVQQFMRQNGYPMSGPWCGQFAASVVASQGGRPPAGAAVASNWRDWGVPVDPKDVQPGDVAVRRGPATGRTGSHVTFVESGIDPATGTFRGFGGNQGGQRGVPNTRQYRAGRFEFRRGTPETGGPPAGAQVAGAPGGAQVPGVAPGNGRIAGMPANMQTAENLAAMREVSARIGADPSAIAGLIGTESAWNPRAVSGSYRGLTQQGSDGGRNPYYANMTSLSPAEQIRSYGAWLARYNIPEKLRQRGIDLAKLPVHEQAAILQGFQFSPNRLAWLDAYATGNPNVRSTGTRQARALGSTSVADMARYYQGRVARTGPGQAPVAAQPAGEPTFRGRTQVSGAPVFGNQVQPPAPTALIDAAVAPPPNVTGNVQVNLHSNGTKATADVKRDGDLFQDTTITQHRQMQPTEKAGAGVSI